MSSLGSLEADAQDSYERWIRNYLARRHPDLVASFRDARAIHSKGLAGAAVSAEEMERLVRHARSPRAPLGENSAALLGELFAKLPPFASGIRALAAGTRSHERINALVALASCPTAELHFELLPALLRDRSARVRALAADRIVSRGMRELAGELQAAVSRETDARVRDELRVSLDYLVQRYHVQKTDEGFVVTCCPPNWSSTSRLFTVDEFAREAKDWIERVLNEAAKGAKSA